MYLNTFIQRFNNYFKLSENTEDLQEYLQEGNAKQILHVALAELTIQRVRKIYS